MTIRNRSFAIALVLLVVAAVPRFYGLGDPGFYGDEETTAFPARALHETGASEMPSGMPYRRALPLTWLNALSASLFGIERELSYRIPSALFGTAMVPLLFFMARPFVGTSVAFLAAVLLALSEWHIATSREARMYAPFVFFYFASAMSILKWASSDENRHLVAAAILFAVTATLHQLSVLAVLFAIIPLAVADWPRVGSTKLISAAVIGGLGGWAYTNFFVLDAFRSWLPDQPEREAGRSLDTGIPLSELFVADPPLIYLLAITGATLGFWCARLTNISDAAPAAGLRQVARYVSCSLAGAMAAVGQLYGSALAALVFLYLTPIEFNALWRKAVGPVIAVAVLATIVIGVAFAQAGLSDGLKLVVGFPYPYPVFLAQMFPVVFLLFAIGTIAIGFQTHRNDYVAYRIFALGVIIPIAVIGAVSRWGGMRYLFEVYPFILLVAAAVLFELLRRLGSQFSKWGDNASAGIAVVIIASGVLGGHGIPQAVNASQVNVGAAVDELVYGFPVYPDHKSPGKFVHDRISAEDLVIAEDPLQQRWYAGRVSYWLRNPERIGLFLYKDANGQRRDIYVNSRPLENREMLDEIVRNYADGRVWLITSGETHGDRESYLSDWQRQWLNDFEQVCKPEYVGADQTTKVFCIDCCRVD